MTVHTTISHIEKAMAKQIISIPDVKTHNSENMHKAHITSTGNHHMARKLERS